MHSKENKLPRILDKISRKQIEGWQLANAAYYTKNAEVASVYRTMAHTVYEDDIHDRIRQLNQRSDDQNELLDAIAEVEGAITIFCQFPGELSGHLKGSGE